MSFSETFLARTAVLARQIDAGHVEELVEVLARVRTLVVIGLGGSAATASHLAMDLRRRTHIQAVCPLDSVCEVTATANDEAWGACVLPALRGDHPPDAVLAISGSGRSAPLVVALHQAKERGIFVLALLGGKG